MTDPAGRVPHALPWPEDLLPDATAVAALVRAAQGDPSRLLALWHLLDARIVRGGHAAWGHRVLGHLLEDARALTGEDITLATWSAYLTTYAECRLRDRGPSASPEAWTRAWSGVQSMPDIVVRAALMARIASGGIAEALAAYDRAQPLDLWVGRLYAVLSDRQVRLTAPAHVAPVIAAVLASVDALESHPDPFLPANPWLERLVMLAADTPRGPERALALACVGRLARHRQDVHVARRRFDQAWHVLLHAPERDLVPCLHWPRGIHVPCSPALDIIRGLVGIEPVAHTVARLRTFPVLSRTLAANRIEALRQDLIGRQRPPPLGWCAPPDADLRVRDHDLGLPSSVAHVGVLPRAAALALDVVDAGQATAGLTLLEKLGAALDTCGNGLVADAVRQAHLRVATRLRLPWSGAAGAPAPDPGGAGFETRLSRADRHAYWRTRQAFDTPSRLALGAWGRAYLLADGPDGAGEWARASAALDLVECAALGVGVALGTSCLVAPVPEDWWLRHPSQPEQAVRLWLRADALGVTRTPIDGALLERVGPRRVATIAEDEGALLALRLPLPALRLLGYAGHLYHDIDDLPGRWRVSILLAMTGVRTSASRDRDAMAAVREAHGRLARALADAGADPLPSWQAVEVRPLAELVPACGAAWVPWLQRAVAVHRWYAYGARPEDVFGAGRGLPAELREWPTQAGA